MSFSISISGHGKPNDELATVETLLREFVEDLQHAGYTLSHATANDDGKTIDGLKLAAEDPTPPEPKPAAKPAAAAPEDDDDEDDDDEDDDDDDDKKPA